MHMCVHAFNHSVYASAHMRACDQIILYIKCKRVCMQSDHSVYISVNMRACDQNTVYTLYTNVSRTCTTWGGRI